jgi:hypothetical protein
MNQSSADLGIVKESQFLRLGITQAPVRPQGIMQTEQIGRVEVALRSSWTQRDMPDLLNKVPVVTPGDYCGVSSCCSSGQARIQFKPAATNCSVRGLKSGSAGE